MLGLTGGGAAQRLRGRRVKLHRQLPHHFYLPRLLLLLVQLQLPREAYGRLSRTAFSNYSQCQERRSRRPLMATRTFLSPVPRSGIKMHMQELIVPLSQ